MIYLIIKKILKSLLRMSKYFVTLIIPMLLLLSCARMGQSNHKKMLTNHDEQFNYSDKNGQYDVSITSGLDKKGKSFFTKRKMEDQSRQKEKVLEKSIVVSSVGILKKKINILRPKISQYNVWFDGKKYTSELKINVEKKAIELKMSSPESQWNGSKQIKFPNSSSLPCFFSQIIDCANISGFISKASDEKNGVMNLMVVWEGYPYLNETFSDFPSEIFSEAQLEYDGITKENERRFNLRVAGQSIFYILNEKNEMIKMLWVSQGITMVNNSVEKSKPEDEGDFE